MRFNDWWEDKGKILSESGCSSKHLAHIAWQSAAQHFCTQVVSAYTEVQHNKDKEYVESHRQHVLGQKQAPDVP